MICPFMSCRNFNRNIECEKGNCALYHEPSKTCSFYAIANAIGDLGKTVNSTISIGVNGNRAFKVRNS